MTQKRIPTDSELARVYRVHRKQIARWKARGIDVHRPGRVLEAVAAQPNPGAVFDNLIRPGYIRHTETAVQCLIHGWEIPEKLTRLLETEP